ncbi:hypothetical protein KCU85_g424, partial [Aureobasidium melanogenum]
MVSWFNIDAETLVMEEASSSLKDFPREWIALVRFNVAVASPAGIAMATPQLPKQSIHSCSVWSMPS